MRSVVAVVIGALIGTTLRLLLDVAIPHADSAFPVSTLLINAIGAFALGVLVARAWARSPDWVRAGLGAGLLGSFTTFSAVAVSLVSLTAAGQWMPALAYLAATMLLGLAAAWLGLRLGRPRGPVAIDPVDE